MMHKYKQYSCYLLLTMDSRGSRVVEGENRAVRNSREVHMNTVYLPYDKTVQAVPYYARKKRQLKSKNYALHHEDELDRRSSKMSVDLDGSKELKPHNRLKQMITEISVQPVINDNKFTNFDPEKYPLKESQKVIVVEEKYFPLQNYYNYVWAVKSNEEIFRIAQETKKKAEEALFSFVGQLLEGDYDQSHKRGPLVKQTMKIKGVHESRFNAYAVTNKMSESREKEGHKVLAPIHVEYKQDLHKKSPFCIKEGERLNILKGQNKQQKFNSRF